MIKKYPVAFPKSMMVKYEPDLDDLILSLLEKDSGFRLGSEQLETEVLKHDYFS